MIEPLHVRSQLFWAPLGGFVLGCALGGLLLPALGPPVAMWSGALLAVCLCAATTFTAWWSCYGTTQGLVSAATLLVVFGGAAFGSASAAIALGGAGRWAAWGGAASLACVLLSVVISTVRNAQALRQQDDSRPWWREWVDWKRGRVAPMPFDSVAQAGPLWRSPWIIGALAANAAALVQAAGTAHIALRVIALVVGFAATWGSWVLVGPLLARALVLREQERARGVVLVHRDLEHVQALRRWRRVP